MDSCPFTKITTYHMRIYIVIDIPDFTTSSALFNSDSCPFVAWSKCPAFRYLWLQNKAKPTPIRNSLSHESAFPFHLDRLG